MRGISAVLCNGLFLFAVAGIVACAFAGLGDLVLSDRPFLDFGPLSERVMLMGHGMLALGAGALWLAGRRSGRRGLVWPLLVLLGMALAGGIALYQPLILDQELFYLSAVEIAVVLAGYGIAGLGLLGGRRAAMASGTGSRLRGRLTRLPREAGLTLATLGLVLVVLEAGVRLYDGEALFSAENYLFRRLDMMTVNTTSDFDPLLGWVMKPNITSDQFYPTGDVPYGFVTTGEFGVRMNQSEIRPVPEGAILAVGDSFTVGSEVDDVEAWPAVLERMLQRPVVNAAGGGWATDQIILRAEQMINRTLPDAVIVAFLSDDILRSGYRVYSGGAKPYFQIEDGRLVHRNNPVPRLQASDSEFGLLRRIVGHSYLVDWTMRRIDPNAWYDSNRILTRADNDPVAVTCLLLQRLKKLTDARDISLGMVMLYNLGQVQHFDQSPDYVRDLMDCVRRGGVAAIDSWEVFRQVFDEDGERGLKELAMMHDNDRVYGHLSPPGNELVAEFLVQNRRRLGF